MINTFCEIKSLMLKEVDVGSGRPAVAKEDAVPQETSSIRTSRLPIKNAQSLEGGWE